jgi:hypothetical protein
MDLINPFQPTTESPLDAAIKKMIEAEENMVRQIMKTVLKREPVPEDAALFQRVHEGDFNKTHLYYVKDNKHAYLGSIEQSYEDSTVTIKFNPNPDLKTNTNE